MSKSNPLEYSEVAQFISLKDAIAWYKDSAPGDVPSMSEWKVYNATQCGIRFIIIPYNKPALDIEEIRERDLDFILRKEQQK